MEAGSWTPIIIICILCLAVFTLPTAEILSGKNARAWISMILYLKKLIKILKQKNPGSRLEVAYYIAQPIQPNLSENGLDWLCYLAGNF